MDASVQKIKPDTGEKETVVERRYIPNEAVVRL
jgi:hypothetical protein